VTKRSIFDYTYRSYKQQMKSKKIALKLFAAAIIQ